MPSDRGKTGGIEKTERTSMNENETSLSGPNAPWHQAPDPPTEPGCMDPWAATTARSGFEGGVGEALADKRTPPITSALPARSHPTHLRIGTISKKTRIQGKKNLALTVKFSRATLIHISVGPVSGENTSHPLRVLAH